jgi:hypothetical protein
MQKATTTTLIPSGALEPTVMTATKVVKGTTTTAWSCNCSTGDDGDDSDEGDEGDNDIGLQLWRWNEGDRGNEATEAIDDRGDRDDR